MRLLALLAALALAGCAAPAPADEIAPAHAGAACPEGSVVTGFAETGTPSCTPSPLADFSCPAGEVLTGFDAAGAPSCSHFMLVADAAMARMAPPEPSQPAKSIAITSSGALADGVKRYTIASASPGMAWSDLALMLNGATLSLAADCEPQPGEYAICRDEAPKGADAPVSAGDTLAIAVAETGVALRLIDTGSNSVIFNITVA